MTTPSLEGIRIFLVDDHPAVREGLQILLSRYGITVCGEAGDCSGAVAGIAAQRPDLALVDLSLCNESGLELLKLLRPSGLKMLVYTMHDDARQIRAALSAGASGYVTKRELTETLREAIAAVLAGTSYLSPVAAAAFQVGLSDDTADKIQKLSPREFDIFRRIGNGDSATDISAALQISISTIETNFARIIAKLELSGTKELRRLAISHRSL